MSKKKRPLSELVQIYENPLEEKDIITHYNIDKSKIEQVEKLQNLLEKKVNEIREDMGITNIPPISLPKEKSEELRKKIHKDQKWREHYDALVSILSPDIDVTKTYDKILIPWWIKPQGTYNGSELQNEKLHLNLGFSHSYLTQLVRARQEGLTIDPVSVSMVLRTSDNFLPLGCRGGKTFVDTLMTLAAGSLELHSQKNPAFESSWAELTEETGLTPRDMEYNKLIAIAKDHELAEQSYFIFEGQTKKTFGEFIACWAESAKDRAEHKYLVGFLDNQEKILSDLQSNLYNPDKSNQTKSITNIENVNTILPPAMISVFAHYAQKYGKQWAEKAEEFFHNNMYDLTSCFKK